MIEKSKAIVLHHLKYTDNSIIVQLYTEKFGRLSFLIRGVRNKKAGRHSALLQPLFILELEFSYRESREMQLIKEFSVSYSPASVISDIRKTSVAIFLGEVLTSVLKEETPNRELFAFLEDSIVYFNECSGNYANFHIAFLAGLCSWLGFEPGPGDREGNTYFDMINGVFVPAPPLHGNYAGKDLSRILASFFSSSYEASRSITLNGALRNEVLETLVKYYSIHLPGLKKIRSLEVLKDVFS